MLANATPCNSILMILTIIDDEAATTQPTTAPILYLVQYKGVRLSRYLDYQDIINLSRLR